jgi:hypothetical protein
MPKLDRSTLEMALVGYAEQRHKIQNAIAEIRSQLEGRSTKAAASVTTDGAQPKLRMSAAARKRIALAQKKRWAAFHKGKEAAAVPEKPKAKRRISAEGLKRIIAATKKRWRLAKAAKTKSSNARKKAPTKVAVKKAVAKKPTPVKMAKGPIRKAAKKLARVTAQPAVAAESAPAPEVGVQP